MHKIVEKIPRHDKELITSHVQFVSFRLEIKKVCKFKFTNVSKFTRLQNQELILNNVE